MQQITNQQRLRPWQGFVLFAVVMALFVTVCSYMQTNWGLVGLFTTEFLFLLIAVAYALILRIPLKEMFPIKKFTARDFFGSLLLVLGGVTFGLISVAIVGILVPSSLEAGDVQSLQKIMGGATGYVMTILLVAVCPAICEEAIHRGAILSNFRSIKKDWVIVLIMGIFFGINHMSVLRFINTAILGACLSYIVVKKNNILLSAMMHFIINFSSTTLSYAANALMKSMSSGSGEGPAVEMTVDTLKTALGSYLMMGVAAPFMIVIGLMLLNPAGHKKIRFLFAGILAAVMLISSFGMTIVSSFAGSVVQTTVNYTVEEEGSDSGAVDFDIEKDGNYNIICVIMSPAGEYSVRVEKEGGDLCFEDKVDDGVIKTYQKKVALDAGSYKLYIINGKDSKGVEVAVSVQVNAA
ncbi:MAG: CPBP family intramembrane metalloprotease [Clostridiales bacterium]|nr:CPBP family intramembrane metalloprotease [Clostridiales bacterium]